MSLSSPKKLLFINTPVSVLQAGIIKPIALKPKINSGSINNFQIKREISDPKSPVSKIPKNFFKKSRKSPKKKSQMKKSPKKKSPKKKSPKKV